MTVCFLTHNSNIDYFMYFKNNFLKGYDILRIQKGKAATAVHSPGMC